MDSPVRPASSDSAAPRTPVVIEEKLAKLQSVTHSILTGNFEDQFSRLDASENEDSENIGEREERDIAEKIVEEQLAHEVILNPSVKLTQDEPQNELFKKVKETMKRAFWDGIKQELINSPPIYDRVIRMFEEIREGFSSLTPKKSPALLQRLNERLNSKELGEQLTSGNFDNEVFLGLVHFCVEYILELEAPIRGDQTRRWLSSFLSSVSKTEVTEGPHLVILHHLPRAFEYVFDKIEEIRIDVINSQLQIAAHYLQHHGLEFERYKFASFINSQPPDAQHKIWQDLASWMQEGKQALQEHQGRPSPREPRLEHILASSYVCTAWAFEAASQVESGQAARSNSSIILRLDTRRMQQAQNQVQLCVLMATHLQAVGAHLAKSRCRPAPADWDELRRMLFGVLTSPSLSLHRLHASWKDALGRLRTDACSEAPAADDDDAFLSQMLGQTCRADDPTYRLLSRRLRRLVTDTLLDPDHPLAESARTLGLAPVLPHIQDLLALFGTFVPHAIRVHRPWASLLAA